MIKGEIVTVYNWFDIQNEICDVMGIPRDKFRDYHLLVGGGYKDLWHTAIKSVVPDNMSNGTIVRVWPIDDIKWLCLKSGEEWAKPFFEAYNAVMEELGCGDGVLVDFCW